jgi:hypothetical protein
LGTADAQQRKAKRPAGASQGRVVRRGGGCCDGARACVAAHSGPVRSALAAHSAAQPASRRTQQPLARGSPVVAQMLHG